MDTLTQEILDAFTASNGSDLYLTIGAPVMVKRDGAMKELRKGVLGKDEIDTVLRALLPPKALAAFQEHREHNSAMDWKGQARFRINAYMQRQMPALVLRRVTTRIPTLAELKLPGLYGDLIMEKRGLIFVVGPTGSGKSTSLASMLNHRNEHGDGHIITIEDPVEFIHDHKKCLVSQRDVGIDTESFDTALKNALRQSPDIIMIGEVRDREAMELALGYAETGHLVLATLHATNASQAIDRILHFFPDESHRQVLLHLSLNLKAILSQRLIRAKNSTRLLAMEILLNQGAVRDLIKEGKISEIRDQIEKNKDSGMQTFEQCLMQYWQAGLITDDTAVAESDLPANMRFMMKQEELSNRMKGVLKST